MTTERRNQPSDGSGSVRSDALRGHLDALILAVLEDGPRHGYAVAEELRRRSGDALDLPTGTLYPALRRLERLGWLDGSWETVNGRRRRVYRLTRSGAAELASGRHEWEAFSGVISAVLSQRPTSA